MSCRPRGWSPVLERARVTAFQSEVRKCWLPSKSAFSHVRKVALDKEKTGRFYAEVPSFELEWKEEGGSGPAFLPLTEVPPPVRSALRMYLKDTVRAGAVAIFFEPPTPYPGRQLSASSMNTLAMTHISFRVDILEA